LTDAPSGRELVEKAFIYISNLARECRKTLAASLQQSHKGMPFDLVEPAMRKEIESWFAGRDRNITIKHENSSKGRLGELSLTYSGSTKDAHFKFHVNALFTLTGPAENAPAYLKAINVNVDKRDFTK
jgi:hypothetical protein